VAAVTAHGQKIALNAMEASFVGESFEAALSKAVTAMVSGCWCLTCMTCELSYDM
jgi:hypothetical protein